MSDCNLQIISDLISKVKNYDTTVIEASVIKYVSQQTGIKFSYEGSLKKYENAHDNNLTSTFKSLILCPNIEFIIDFFEALLERKNIIQNGIVFTPQYIADYIFMKATENYNYTRLPKIIDPSCGCGIFLAQSAVRLHDKTGLPFREILNDCIYGIELDEDNARRCEITLNLLPLLHGESNKGVVTNIKCLDSLKCNWGTIFNCGTFDFIFGNPPYVNTHDMAKETSKFLKDTFMTTKTGVYNIFYAFIEHAHKFLNKEGILSYIVPNNFLTIKSATDLRKFITDNKCLKLIIDFANNMVFKPVRTYNCIIQLTKETQQNFLYSVMEDSLDIELELKHIEFNKMQIDKLDYNGWKLVNKTVMENIEKIEGQFKCIKEFIRTGIATLKDNVYIVDKDEQGYYKILNNQKYYLEDNTVKRLYKIPELKNDDNLQNCCKYIIFPYKKGLKGFEIIDDNELQTLYPKTYKYLQFEKQELDSRDKGKPNTVAWYAYGRSQGLNKYGAKLLFPTFANSPRFKFIDDEFALFCNGYAVFENDYIDLDILQRILNSELMHYYVSNTSYSIEGGYYCYQKKYIEKFSIPIFSENEKRIIKTLSEQELNKFLFKRYDLDI